MCEQLELTMRDPEEASEAEMLVRRFQQLTGRAPTEQELKDAQERLDQIKGTDD